jgi:hypothetical protein
MLFLEEILLLRVKNRNTLIPALRLVNNLSFEKDSCKRGASYTGKTGGLPVEKFITTSCVVKFLGAKFLKIVFFPASHAPDRRTHQRRAAERHHSHCSYNLHVTPARIV